MSPHWVANSCLADYIKNKYANSIINHDSQSKKRDVNQKFLEFELPYEVDRSVLIDVLDMLKSLHIIVSRDNNINYLKKTIFFENRKKEIISIVEKLSLSDYDSEEIQKIIDHFIKNITIGGVLSINDIAKKRESNKLICKDSDVDAREILKNCSLDKTHT